MVVRKNEGSNLQFCSASVRDCCVISYSKHIFLSSSSGPSDSLVMAKSLFKGVPFPLSAFVTPNLHSLGMLSGDYSTLPVLEAENYPCGLLEMKKHSSLPISKLFLFKGVELRHIVNQQTDYIPLHHLQQWHKVLTSHLMIVTH